MDIISGKKILLVDDSQTQIKTNFDFLISNGFSVETADSGRQALQLF